MRKFVLVTATRSNPNSAPEIFSGIKKLKRGVSLTDFLISYLEPLNLPNEREIFMREHILVIHRQPDLVLTWTFTEYPEEDLIHAVRHLTREEMLRDLKELLPLRDVK